MTREEAIGFGKMWLDINSDAKDSITYEFFEQALEVLKAEPCDAVSREAMLKVVDEWYDNNREVENIEDLIVALTYISSVTPASRWIPVTERLPESAGVYIVTREFTDGFECVDLTDACYFDGTSTWYNDNRINHGREYVDKKIKAWIPLPEPYKAESEANHG